MTAQAAFLDFPNREEAPAPRAGGLCPDLLTSPRLRLVRGTSRHPDVNTPLAQPASEADAERARRDAQLCTLVAGAAAGDAQAFERFYDATVGYAQALARRMLAGGDLDDVLSDAYFQAWREAARFDPQRGSPVTWLLTIVRSRALDLMRRHRAAHEEEAQELPEDQPGDAPSPPDLLAATERCSALHAALAGLSPQERWLLGLAYFRELSHARIAETTGLPLGTVKSAILRAQAKLRDTLAADGAKALLP